MTPGCRRPTRSPATRRSSSAASRPGPWCSTTSTAADGSTIYTPGADGVKSVDVRQTDVAGNVSPATTFVFTLDTTPPPEIRVTGGGLTIVDGDATPSAADGTDFGAVAVNEPGPSRTYRVWNDGVAALVTSGFTAPAGFAITDPLADSIPGGSYDDVTLQLQTTALGTVGGAVSFTNNDDDGGDGLESPFDFRIAGKVSRRPTVAMAAAATPSSTGGTTTALSVLGTDDGGEASLRYTWAATMLPAARRRRASAPTAPTRRRTPWPRSAWPAGTPSRRRSPMPMGWRPRAAWTCGSARR